MTAITIPRDSTVQFTDIVTNDVSTSKHGFVPKAPNDTAKYLRGDATWATVSAGTVTSVAQSFTGGIITVSGSPITGSATIAKMRLKANAR